MTFYFRVFLTTDMSRTILFHKDLYSLQNILFIVEMNAFQNMEIQNNSFSKAILKNIDLKKINIVFYL